MKLKELLQEAIFDRKNDEHVNQIKDFVKFVNNYYEVPSSSVILVFDRKNLTTTACYGNGKSIVYAKDRGFLDICRSIAHELTHFKQDLDGRLTDIARVGADGSDIENEANSKAGEIIRVYGRLNPHLYD